MAAWRDGDIDSDISGRSCRFVDYAPYVFANLRESFGIDNDDYIHSMGPSVRPYIAAHRHSNTNRHSHPRPAKHCTPTFKHQPPLQPPPARPAIAHADD